PISRPPNPPLAPPKLGSYSRSRAVRGTAPDHDRKEPDMTTTSYGTWNNRVDGDALTVEQTIAETLGDADEYDIDAIAADYRTAINKALPEGVTLAGNDFYGPYYTEDATWGPE